MNMLEASVHVNLVRYHIALGICRDEMHMGCHVLALAGTEGLLSLLIANVSHLMTDAHPAKPGSVDCSRAAHLECRTSP